MTDLNPMRSLVVGLLAREAINAVPGLPHFTAVQLAERAMSERDASDSSPQLYLELCDMVVAAAYSCVSGEWKTTSPAMLMRPLGDREHPVTIRPLESPTYLDETSQRIPQEPGTDEP